MKKLLLFVLIGAMLLSVPASGFARGVVKKDIVRESSIVKVGEDVTVSEKTKVKDVVAIRGNVFMKGEATGDVVAVLGTVHLFPTAKVGGDAVSVGGTVIKHDGAEVEGNIVEVGAGMQESLPYIGAFAATGLAVFGVVMALGIIALAMLIVAFMTKQVGTISSRIERNPWKSLLWGILGGLLIVPVAILLLVTIIGIPLILVEVVLVSCGMILGLVAVSQLIGKKIAQALRKPNQPMMLETIIGLVVLLLVALIPVLGGIVKCLAMTVGFGAALTTKLGYK